MTLALLSRFFGSTRSHFISQSASPFSRVGRAFYQDSEREKLAERIDELSKRVEVLEDMMQASLTLTLKSAITVEVVHSRLDSLIDEVRALRKEQKEVNRRVEPLKSCLIPK